MEVYLCRQFTKVLLILLAVLIITPIFFGFLGFFLPSFGYFPAIGRYDFDLSYFNSSFDLPGISKSFKLSVFTGLFSTILALFFSQVILLKLFQPLETLDKAPSGLDRHELNILVVLISFRLTKYPL